MTLVGCVPCTNNVSFNLDAIDILDELALLASFVVPIAPLYECSHLAGMVRRRSTRERGRSNANPGYFPDVELDLDNEIDYKMLATSSCT